MTARTRLRNGSVIEMHYKELTDFFLCTRHENNDLPELLQILCLRTLSDYRFEGMVLCLLEHDGLLRLHASFGLDPVELRFPQEGFSIHDKTPCSDAIKEQEVILIENVAAMPDYYRKTLALNIPNSFKGLASIPILTHSRILGSILAFTTKPKVKNDQLLGLLSAIGWALGDRLAAASYPAPSTADRAKFDWNFPVNGVAPRELTERQNLILQMISEGRTNGDIADLLGYSESLIRQETIRIYAFLGCSGRAEAARIYRDKRSIEPLENASGPRS